MKRMFWLVLLALAPVVASANTRFGFGTVMDVDWEGKRPENKGAPSFTVFHEFRNLVDGREFDTRTYRIAEKTRHGDRVYLLDGKPSTARDALQAGRAVTTADNDMVIFVSSTVPGPEAAPGKKEAGEALYFVTTGDSQLILDVAGGKIVAGIRIPPRTEAAPWLPADVSGLKVEGDKIMGVDPKATCRLLNRPQAPEPLQVWLRLEAVAAMDKNHTYVVIALAEKTGLFLHKKGHVLGAITAHTLVVKDGKLAGNFTVQLAGAPATFTVTGNVLGNRVVAGEFTSDKGHQGRCRGGLTDARGPQLRGCTSEQQSAVKQMQAKP
jgi:hypothetical protein